MVVLISRFGWIMFRILFLGLIVRVCWRFVSLFVNLSSEWLLYRIFGWKVCLVFRLDWKLLRFLWILSWIRSFWLLWLFIEVCGKVRLFWKWLISILGWWWLSWLRVCCVWLWLVLVLICVILWCWVFRCRWRICVRCWWWWLMMFVLFWLSWLSVFVLFVWWRMLMRKSVIVLFGKFLIFMCCWFIVWVLGILSGSWRICFFVILSLISISRLLSCCMSVGWIVSSILLMWWVSWRKFLWLLVYRLILVDGWNIFIWFGVRCSVRVWILVRFMMFVLCVCLFWRCVIVILCWVLCIFFGGIFLRSLMIILLILRKMVIVCCIL